jgi:PAS domain S-box-containing protein
MPSPRRLALLVLLALVYFAVGRLALSLALVNASITAVWPPTGIALAACLLAGPSVWPALFVGAFLVNVTNTGMVFPSLLIACGNTAEALVATWLIRRFADGAGTFEKTIHVLVYVAAAAVATAVAASVGVTALTLGNLATPSDTATTWITWWAGDLSGALLVTPAIVTWVRERTTRLPSRRLTEVFLLVLALAAVCYWVFGPTAAGTRSYPLMFLVLPVLLWAALRFGARGATAAILVTAGIATVGTLAGYGPFARQTLNESLLLLQAYLCMKMIVMLSLSAEVAARRGVEREMRELNEDLARRVEARAEDLQRLHGRLVEAQDVAHIGSWEWDVTTNNIWWSDEMYRLYGLSVGSPITYERYTLMVHPDDRALTQEIVRRSVETGEPFTFEHRAVTPDGTERVLLARGRVVKDEAGRVVRMLGIGHDITDRKRAEEERLALVREQAARREAEEANRMKDYFLATLSHELRTPLNTIAGWAQMLKERSDDEGLRRRAVEAIHRNVSIQVKLVSDILDVARIRSGTLSIDAAPVSVIATLEGALEIMQPMIDAKGIEVQMAVAEGVAVIGDARRLQQVFWNVLSNAAKFVPPGGHIFISAQADGDEVRITLEDDGPGIADDFLPHVFEQFRQADPSITREHGGMGLGLSISRDLVQLHGGTMTAANRPQGGAVFTVRLPAALRRPTAHR